MESVRSNSVHHFCKIIVSGHIGSQSKLMIPRKFVKKYGNSLPDRVFLKTPDGIMSWAVALERSGNEVWLTKGWSEFAKFHSLSFGHFLIFGCQESSKEFDVVICDKTASEIEYPLSVGNKTINPRDSLKEYTRKEDMDSSDASMQAEGGNGADENEAIASAKAFKSRNPCYRITIYPSCITRSGGLSISRVFLRKFMTKERDDVTLQVERRTWPVKCYLSHLTIARLGSGWTAFARDNNLSAGDVCIFELIDCKKKLLNVSIIRANMSGKC